MVRKGYRKKSRWLFLFLIIPVLAAGISGYGWYTAQMRYTEIKGVLEQLKSNRKQVYVAVTDLMRGTVLSECHVMLENRYTDELQETYISEDDFGSVLMNDIPAGTCILDMMMSKNVSDTREVYMEYIELAEYVEAGERIDVRIRFANAEDYVVLADKRILARGAENAMVLELTE